MSTQSGQSVHVLSEPRRSFFTVRTLACYLAMGEVTIREMVGAGSIPSYKIGGSRRFSADEIDCWLASKHEGAA